MKQTDTIAAVGTPYGKGGVAMIRISGPEAIAVGCRIFHPLSVGNDKKRKQLSDIPHANTVYGKITMPDDSESIDDGMATAFYAPRSFTGENTVEITCHGGILITKQVLAAALCAGARMAEAGEFTRRAFINGKMRLTQAEALGNLLEAKTEGQLTLARSGLQGLLAERIDSIYESLTHVMASVYAVIDFPDEDLSEMSRDEILQSLTAAKDEVDRLAATYRTGRAVTEGIPTVICGRTNAGKSSVYNRILGYDAAIVTDIEGTTRDVLRETAVLGKTTLLLCDTAGLRETGDRVEEIGIERTRQELARAGLILAVFDGSRSLTEDDLSVAEQVKLSGIPAIALWNKSDCGHSLPPAVLSDYFDADCILPISARDGIGFDLLAKQVDHLMIDGELDFRHDAVVTGARQFAALHAASEALTIACRDLSSDIPMDLCCLSIEAAMSALSEADGRSISQDVVSEIFSKFCVGK